MFRWNKSPFGIRAFAIPMTFKNMLNRLYLTILILFIAPAVMRADILIYQGVTRQVTAGNGETLRAKFNIYNFIDTEQQMGFSIPYHNRNGVKTYQRGSTHPVEAVKVSNGRGKNSTVIMWPITREAEDPDNIAESLLMFGQDVSIQTGIRTISFPSVFDHTQISIEWRDSDSSYYHHTFKTRLLLNRSQTLRANTDNETLEQAADRFAEMLESQGYTFEEG
jgi:hypothetical protein